MCCSVDADDNEEECFMSQDLTSLTLRTAQPQLPSKPKAGRESGPNSVTAANQQSGEERNVQVMHGTGVLAETNSAARLADIPAYATETETSPR